MTVHFADDAVTVHHGDCLADGVLAGLRDASVDAVITDPPYGISFMGKQWDQPGQYGSRSRRGGGPNHRRGAADAALNAGTYDLSPSAMRNFQSWCEAWSAECLRILKPGGHLLAFGGSRTWHRLAAGIEDAGLEVRDSIAWLYGQGFPKSKDLGDGRGTALKPAFEPIVVARKPFRGSVTANVLVQGTGALNIDACRVGCDERVNPAGGASSLQRVSRVQQGYRDHVTASQGEASAVHGRWPTNVVLDGDQAEALDAQSGIRRGMRRGELNRGATTGRSIGSANVFNPAAPQTAVAGYDDEGGASRFFPVFRYEAKATGSERPSIDGTSHPTVKPLELMRWLVRLVTPPGGLVLDPFGGSGTTAEACVLEHMRCITIEREADYLPLIVTRLTKPMAIGFDFTSQETP